MNPFMEALMPRRIVISLDRDLPARPGPLSSDALSKVFGGCGVKNQPCVPNTSGQGNCCTLPCVAVDRRGAIFYCGG